MFIFRNSVVVYILIILWKVCVLVLRCVIKLHICVCLGFTSCFLILINNRRLQVDLDNDFHLHVMSVLGYFHVLFLTQISTFLALMIFRMLTI